jgi:hypothetical protein
MGYLLFGEQTKKELKVCRRFFAASPRRPSGEIAETITAETIEAASPKSSQQDWISVLFIKSSPPFQSLVPSCRPAAAPRSVLSPA